MIIPKPLVYCAILLFVTVFALGVFAIYTATTYKLPMTILPIIATALGPIDALSTYRSIVNAPTSRRTSRPPLPHLHLAINLALLILPTVLTALGAPYLGSQVSKCQLKDTWQAWYSAHDKNAIKGVQDALQCCGFGKATEMPFPFPKDPKKGDPTPPVKANTCAIALGHDTPCAPAWEGELKVVAGLVVAAAAISILMKVAFLMITIGRPAFSEEWFARRDYTQYDTTRTIEPVDDEESDEDEVPPPHVTRNVPGPENGINERTGLLTRGPRVEVTSLQGIDGHLPWRDSGARNFGSND
ncbi:hypothetical protein TWF718_007489 [Orbilia javanica]|uniref:Tetraspanin n=1 Tax=Orbilia javanica TaxID=47235 RepID=A0AAN8RJ33_9PEZI